MTSIAAQLTILRNADVRVMDEAGTRTDTLAWRDGKLIDPADAHGAEEVDAGGRIVLPGFIDPHQHAALAALYGASRPLVPPDVTDIPSLQRAIADEAKRLSGDDWLVLTEWNEELLRERRAPTRAELDDALPDRPLFAMHYSCHRAVVNSRGLERAGIDKSTPDPNGGIIERGGGGLPTGLLIERGMALVEGLARASLVARDADGFLSRLGQHYRAMASAGITRVVDAMVPEDLALLFEEADRRGLLILPTTIMPAAVTGGYLEAPWSALETQPTGTMRGKNLKVGPVKLVFDGTPVCAMCLGWWQVAGTTLGALAMTIRQGSLAAIRVSLSSKPTLGAKLRSGILMYDPTSAREIMAAASDRRFAIATHAIGNAAVDLALDAFAATKHRDGAGTARLEHASFLSSEQVKRIADLGIAVVTQPHFVTLPAIAHAPPIPGLSYQPLRSLLEAGVTVAGSSDYPVTSFEPLVAIRSALRRLTPAGHVNEPDERIDLEQAFALYTRNAAKAAGCLHEAGTLEQGKRADLVILDGKDEETFRVRATVVGGKTMHGEI